MSSRNAEPEQVALAVLDAFERAVRGNPPDYDDPHDEDAAFMRRSVEGIKSRLRVLKRQAAAGWKPEFTRMLDNCHSIAVEKVNWAEKEGVRSQKLRCMACGRHEHCCTYGLHAVGPFAETKFNKDSVSALSSAWTQFIDEYEAEPEGAKAGELPIQDNGIYTIGSTCMRKAELYYIVNTMILEGCYEAYQTWMEQEQGEEHAGWRWYYATQENVDVFMKKLEDLEIAIADEKHRVPDWGTDVVLWTRVAGWRDKSSGGDDDLLVELLRKRAEQVLARTKSTAMPQCVEESSSQDDSEEEDECTQQIGCKRSAPRRKPRRVLDSEDEDEDEADCANNTQKRGRAEKKAKVLTAPVRKSRRQMRLSPESNSGDTEDAEDAEDADDAENTGACSGMPHNEGENAPVLGNPSDLRGLSGLSRSRMPRTDAFDMPRAHQECLVSNGNVLANLGALQVKLLREARLEDAAVCTNAMFELQGLRSFVSELKHQRERESRGERAADKAR